MESNVPREPVGSQFLNKQITGAVSSLLESVGVSDAQELPLALLFPTRPFSIPEIYLLVPGAFSGDTKEKLRDWACAFRGYAPGEIPPDSEAGHNIVHHIPYARPRSGVRIAVTSWKTEVVSWRAAAMQREDPDPDRYARLHQLLNGVLRARERPDYVVLPELSVPARWFLRLASKLSNRGISLIAGIEYLHCSNVSNVEVENKVWASLTCDLPGLRFVVCSQDKWQAAQEEEAKLWNTAGLRVRKLEKRIPKPIWHHGDFLFSILICSELTNIDFRSELRGRIDALFVPEWNQDTETFSSLVESSALDIHAYIIQCNNRLYGDSRVRTPAKDSWKRDLIRVKGGEADYFVVGKLDVLNLRRFQSSYRSDKDGDFKPVPDGFEIDPARRLLP